MNAISPGAGQLTVPELTAAARRSGSPAGRDAADWRAQDTVGGRAPAHRSGPAARRILAALDDGDPAIYDALPVPAQGDVAAAYNEAAPRSAPPWHDLPAPAREAFDAAYADAYTTAVITRIARICRYTLEAADSSGDPRE